jgi:hypothetical protein
LGLIVVKGSKKGERYEKSDNEAESKKDSKARGEGVMNTIRKVWDMTERDVHNVCLEINVMKILQNERKPKSMGGT